jgi:hypothetical protein
MQCILCKIYFWKVFHKYYNLICTPICTKKFYSCKKWVLQCSSPARPSGSHHVRPNRGPARPAPTTQSPTQLPTWVKLIQPRQVNPVKPSCINSGDHPLWISFKNLMCLIPFRGRVVRLRITYDSMRRTL